MPSKSFIAGMEEAVARLLSLVVTLIFFTIYILSKEIRAISLDWSGLMFHLGIFWLVYELVSYILYLILEQFSKASKLAQIVAKNNEIATQNSPTNTVELVDTKEDTEVETLP